MLEQNRDALDFYETHKSGKPFKLISKGVPKRNSEQCRSHHQKMLKKFKSIENIIAHFRG